MERPPKKYVCEKCGYLGDTPDHEGCDYLAWITGEQLYIDRLERELALLKASPASAPEGLFVREDAMHESNGRVTYFVHIAKSQDAKPWDCYVVYSDAIQGRAQYEAAQLRHFLGQGPKPDILTFDTDAPTPPVSEDRWLPIETAPKDRFVLLAGPSGYTTIETVFATGRMCSDYHVGRWIDHANDDLTDWGFEPTHWMPLPKAPAMQEDKP